MSLSRMAPLLLLPIALGCSSKTDASVAIAMSTNGRALWAPTSTANGFQVEHGSREARGRATGFLRARLAALLDLERLPKLSFTFVGSKEPEWNGPQEGGEPWHE